MRIFTFIIKCAMAHRFSTLGLCIALAAAGFFAASRLPVDILPRLDKSVVTIVTEAPGMAPEEIETLVNIPIETSLAGLSSVTKMRSSAAASLSLVNVEFGWDTDIYRVRQLIQERLATAKLPEGITPIVAPVSSVMGEIMVVGVWSDSAQITPMRLRTIADRDIARRLMNIAGVSQVLSTGGGLRQYRIIPDTAKMAALGVSVAELSEAAKNAQSNSGGGISQTGGSELLVRNIGRSDSVDDIADAVVKKSSGSVVRIRDIAKVAEAPAQLRGDAAVNGRAGVILTVQKQPDADTIAITKAVEQQLAKITHSLKDVKTEILYRQDGFINAAISNVEGAIADGSLMVVGVLLFFLLSLRTTLVTLTAIPLSFGLAMLWFAYVGEPVNTMFLGGLAVAVGMLVDDAIVDVENVHRRLRENSALAVPRKKFDVILDACVEIRASIFYATAIIMIVFLPTLGLEGLEGKMFKPLAVAVIVSMAASFVVALTAIPALCAILFGRSSKKATIKKEPISARIIKRVADVLVVRPSVKYPKTALAICACAAACAFALLPLTGRDFMPQFNEGNSLLIVQISSDSSIDRSKEIGAIVEKEIAKIPEAGVIGMKIGRAEGDDHAEPVNVIKFNIGYKSGGRHKDAVLAELRERLGTIAGISHVITPPMAHRIDYMLHGSQSNIAVKIFGSDIGKLKEKADALAAKIRMLDGASDVTVEKQEKTLELRIAPDRKKAALYGIQVGRLNAILSELLGGRAVAQVYDDGMLYDVFIRADEAAPRLLNRIENALVENIDGQKFPISSFAKVYYAKGANQINRENMQRRIVVSLNSSGGDSVKLAEQIESLTANLGDGYYAKVEGQFRNRIDAERRIGLLFAAAMILIFSLLCAHFKSANITLQILVGVPTAFAGGIALTWYMLGTMSVASLVGMVALAGIAARNTIMLVSHYLHLATNEGMDFGKALVERGTLERVNPILMTALTAGLALTPIMWNPSAEGNELLCPVSVMIVGGLLSSTILSFSVSPALFMLLGKKPCREALENAEKERKSLKS